MVGGSSRREVGLSAHAHFVRSELRRLGVSVSDLDDLMQEVWLVGLARSRTFSDETATHAWLGKVCRQVASVDRESRVKTRLVPRGASPELPVEPEQVAHVEDEVDELKSLAALERLSAKQLDVLALYGSGELTMREVADLVGEPEKTVYSRYRSAIDEMTRELRRSDAVGLRATGEIARAAAPVAAHGIPLYQEHAADLGEMVIYQAGPQLTVGRAGNAVIAAWRERIYERSSDSVGAVLHAAHARLQVPLVLINLGGTDLPLPNARERAALFQNIRATRHHVCMVVDAVSNGVRYARLMKSIFNGLFLVTRSYLHMSFVLVDNLEEARGALAPHLRSIRGALPWESVLQGAARVLDSR